jgi:thiamine monophosphate synthase
MMKGRSITETSGSGRDFLLVVLTAPKFFPGEAEYLEGLLEAGLERLHLRKPGASSGRDGMATAAAAERKSLEALLERLAPRWRSRLVLHGSREWAERYGIGQIHGPVRYRIGSGSSGGGGKEIISPEGLAISTSVHSWEEVKALPEGVAYTFLSPLFDSISKPGYMANTGLMQRPAGLYPCKVIGMGGIGGDTIGEVLRGGWDGAAVLGWIWQEPPEAVRRFERLKKILANEGE